MNIEHKREQSEWKNKNSLGILYDPGAGLYGSRAKASKSCLDMNINIPHAAHTDEKICFAQTCTEMPLHIHKQIELLSLPHRLG